MNYFGLDYGTTTSLLYSYECAGCKEILRMRSAVMATNGSIEALGAVALGNANDFGVTESPKRGINNLDSIGRGAVTYKEMIEALLCKMLETLKQNMGQENLSKESHITLTVPNSYGAANYISMYQMLGNCLNKVFGNNHNISIHLLPEPVAAALFYVQRHLAKLPQTSHLVVCDIGGGTTDICIIKCEKRTDRLNFSVIKDSIEQSDKIGGNVFDKALEGIINLPLYLNSNQKIILCQNLKCGLSSSETATIVAGTQAISCTRKDFKTAISNHLDELSTKLDNIVRRTNSSPDDTWYILPIGGSCKIPAIQRRLENAFPGARQTVNDEKTIFDGVAQGAAIFSAWCGNALKIGNFLHINIENRTPHEYMFYSAYGTWETLVPANACDGIYPQDDKPNIRPIAPKIKNGKYTVGKIKLSEKEANAKPIECEHTQDFSLNGRKSEEIELQLGVEIKNCLIAKWWLKDCLTGERQDWTY